MKRGATSNSHSVIYDDLNPEARIVLHCGDAENYLPTLPDGLVGLIVTSPPYNVGKPYEKTVAIQDYLQAQEEVVSQLCRLLADNGSICWQVGNYIQDGEVYPLDFPYYHMFKQRDMKLRNRIIWRYGHGLHTTRRFSGRYETILWFTKGDAYTFNLDAVRIPAKYPGKRYSNGPKKGQPSGNPRGKNPSDYWEIVAHDWAEEVWDIPNVKANHPEKVEHPCQFPIELVERCVLALSNADDWVLDPFAGVGSSLIAAIKHNRRAIGCDKEEVYVAQAQRRIDAFLAGDLKFRPIERPLHEPKSTDRVASIPEEWRNLEDSIYSSDTEK